MSDPRASIARTVLAPPPSPAVAAPASPATVPDVEETVRLIGKPHGRMRCVNLRLTPEAKEALYAQAHADGVTLGEALMDLVAHASVRPRTHRPGRSAVMRRGVDIRSVFVLLTADEAREVVTRASATGRSVSDYVSTAIG